MKQRFQLMLLLTVLHVSASAQQYGVIVKDKKATAKSNENMAVNIVKQQEYGNILDLNEYILVSYTQMEALQQKVLEDLKQAETVKDLHWADLSKSLYLAHELIKGAVQPGIEIDYVIKHPLFQDNPDEIYQDIFITGSGAPLPTDLNSFKQAKQRSQTLTYSFQKLAAERKAYAAVAYQYLAEDLILKSTEMNDVLRQHNHFSMTEAERMRLQSYAEEYLQLAGEMLEKSDKLLLEIAYCRHLQNQSAQEQKRLERSAISRTTVLDY